MLTKPEEFAALLFVVIAYPLIAGVLLRLPLRVRWAPFAAFNIASVFSVAFLSLLLNWIPFTTDDIPKFLRIGPAMVAAYVGAVLLNYAALRISERKSRVCEILAYVCPIATLLALRVGTTVGHLPGQGVLLVVFLGISYVCFRLCHLVSEVKNGLVEMPSVSQYLAFAFYVPLLFVGPISSYSKFKASIERGPKPVAPILRIVTRILVGIAKFVFISAVLSEVTYGIAFLADGHPHNVLDLVIAVLVYPAYLYMNFSGMCDIAIGVSAAIGIDVIENFDRPFAARNFQEFWNRWHMSLSVWARDMVFTPFVKTIGRKLPRERMTEATALGIMLVFLVIGLWHGFTLNFVLFGLTQGLGVVVVHYATLRHRKRLGKEGFERYRANRLYYAMGVAGTYAYFAATLFLFANTIPDIKDIFSHLVL